MRISPTRCILLWTFPALVLAAVPAAAQHSAPDTRGRVYTLIGGALGGVVDVRLWRGLGVGVDVRWLRVLLNYDHVDTAQVSESVSYRF